MSDEAETIVLLEPETQDGFRRVELCVGNVRYRATVFDTGEIRIWDVASFRLTGEHSIIMQPYGSIAAQEESRRTTGPDMPDNPYFRLVPLMHDGERPPRVVPRD